MNIGLKFKMSLELYVSYYTQLAVLESSLPVYSPENVDAFLKCWIYDRQPVQWNPGIFNR